MEGPSLFLAQEQRKPFKRQTVQSAEGNTSLDISHLPGLEVKDIFSWGKHLVFQW
jgi:endonuclease-8